MGIMNGKVCVVTGGGGSIGLAAAQALLNEGARVLLVGRSPEKLAWAAASLGLAISLSMDNAAMLGRLREVDAFVARLASFSGTVLRMSKRAVKLGLESGLPAIEKYYLNDLMQTQDAVEGLNAFMEKRSPVWKNK